MMSLQCDVVHAVPGRVRLRIEPPQIFTDLAAAFEAFLLDQSGIQEVRLNPSCRSAVLTYDSDLLKPADLMALIQGASLDQLKTYQPRHPHLQPKDSLLMGWLPLGLSSAAAAQQRLTHPVAEAIVQTAQDRGIGIPARDGSEYTIGLGVEAAVDGAVILVLADPLRLEARAVVHALRAQGVQEVVMPTGDHAAVAKKVADALGIIRYIAEALPAQKAELVRALQLEGHTVAVVGDGINDSPALAQADVGIAMHGGADVARETAHVALLEGNLWKVPQAIDIARQSMHLIQQNWNLVFYPNTVAIALSLPGLMGPIGATLISNGSAILATLNALRPLLGSSAARSTP